MARVVSLGLVVLTIALLVVGSPVVLAPGQTARLFAWTIDMPLTAAFLGACYWTAALLILLASREREWASVRAVMPGILIAGTLILVATLLHLDRFAMDTLRGWIWVILYAGLPPGLLALLALQQRVGGTDRAVLRPIGRRGTVLLTLAATVLVLAGAALFTLGTGTDWWPWPLTELTARMIGAWLAAIGATLAAALRERDYARVRPAMVYLAAVAIAQLATLARYPGAMQWHELSAWIYIAFCGALLGSAVIGLRLGTEPTSRARPTRARVAPEPTL